MFITILIDSLEEILKKYYNNNSIAMLSCICLASYDKSFKIYIKNTVVGVTNIIHEHKFVPRALVLNSSMWNPFLTDIVLHYHFDPYIMIALIWGLLLSMCTQQILPPNSALQVGCLGLPTRILFLYS